MLFKIRSNFYSKNWPDNYIIIWIILFIFLFNFPIYNTSTNVLADDSGNDCITRSFGAKGDSNQVPVSFPSPTWALCLTNATNMVLNYSKRWGPNDSWDTHTLYPNETRAHWCNPKRAQCFAPFMIIWSDASRQYSLNLDHYVIAPGCLRCSTAKNYYFWFDGRSINLSPR